MERRSEDNSQHSSRARGRDLGRTVDSAIDELVGMCRGVLADGAVTDGEAEMLLRWIEANRGVARQFPANVLYPRLRAMLVDKTLSVEEQGELLQALHELTGGPMTPTARGGSRIRLGPTGLPLDNPPPRIEFWEERFCFTGRFLFGNRDSCETEVFFRGGETDSEPNVTTSYLVIGHLGSPQWKHSSFGRKIERAVELRAQGAAIRIVSEEHWVSALRENDLERAKLAEEPLTAVVPRSITSKAKPNPSDLPAAKCGIAVLIGLGAAVFIGVRIAVFAALS